MSHIKIFSSWSCLSYDYEIIMASYITALICVLIHPRKLELACLNNFV